MGRSSKDKRDIFYRLAKQEGWRARSAYKLLHLDYELKLLQNVTRAVDLCAAPGSWSQVLAQSMKPLESPGKCIVAVDLQEMAPIPGVQCFSGDITSDETAGKVIQLLGNAKADIVVCDGAPDVTGYHIFDEHLQSGLFMAALKISVKVLAENGTFLAKIFRSSDDGVKWLFSKAQLFFKDVMIAKPRSSRSTSVEAYIVGRQFSPPSNFTSSNFEEILQGGQKLLEKLSQLTETICGKEDLESDVSYPSSILIDHKYEFSVPPPNLEVLTEGYSAGYEPPGPELSNLPSYEDALLARNTRKLLSMQIKSGEKSEVEPEAPGNTRTLKISFGGGAENLVNCGREITVSYPASEKYSFELRGVLNHIKDYFIVDRPELFMKDDDVRPGILVLINDTDWEILDKLDYEVQEGDSIAFISTLHGG